METGIRFANCMEKEKEKKKKEKMPLVEQRLAISTQSTP